MGCDPHSDVPTLRGRQCPHPWDLPGACCILAAGAGVGGMLRGLIWLLCALTFICPNKSNNSICFTSVAAKVTSGEACKSAHNTIGHIVSFNTISLSIQLALINTVTGIIIIITTDERQAWLVLKVDSKISNSGFQTCHIWKSPALNSPTPDQLDQKLQWYSLKLFAWPQCETRTEIQWYGVVRPMHTI